MARELAAGSGYRTDGQGGFDHDAVISLLNDNGEIVFQQCEAKAESDALLAKLKGLLEAMSFALAAHCNRRVSD